MIVDLAGSRRGDAPSMISKHPVVGHRILRLDLRIGSSKSAWDFDSRAGQIDACRQNKRKIYQWPVNWRFVATAIPACGSRHERRGTKQNQTSQLWIERGFCFSQDTAK